MKFNLATTILLAGSLLVGCNETQEESLDSAEEVTALADEDTAVGYEEDNLGTGSALEEGDIDFDAPAIDDPALAGSGVELRGYENYRIYSVGQDVMFALDKAEIRPSGEEKLQRIADVIKERDRDAAIRIYGFTDALASPEYNMELSRERARAVESWFQENSELDTDRMKIYPMGENYFEATNETPVGRQQNRRVEIVVVDEE